MLTAPLVMPEVITGLSLLLFFIALKECLFLAHTRFYHYHHCPYHFLDGLRHVDCKVALDGVGVALEEAAQDLGARPFRGHVRYHNAIDGTGRCWLAGYWRLPCRWMI